MSAVAAAKLSDRLQAAMRAGKLDAVRIQNIDAGIMRVHTGIVMNIDTRKRFALAHDVRNRLHHVGFAAVIMRCAGPDPVVVKLRVKPALLSCCGFNVTDQDRHRARKWLVCIGLEQAFDCVKSCSFIAIIGLEQAFDCVKSCSFIAV